MLDRERRIRTKSRPDGVSSAGRDREITGLTDCRMPQDSRIPSSKLGRAYDLNCKSIKLHKQPGEREILGCASSNFRFPCGTNCVELLKREQHTVSPCMHPHGIPYAPPKYPNSPSPWLGLWLVLRRQSLHTLSSQPPLGSRSTFRTGQRKAVSRR